MMNIVRAESLIAVKFDSDDRQVIERAANAVCVARAVAVKEKKGGIAPIKGEVNEGILAIGAITKRIKENRAPVYGTPVEGGLAISLGEEGSTVFQEQEVATLSGFLREYSDATVDAVPSYTHTGGLNTQAWERAFYGFAAGVMATELSKHLTPSTTE